MVGENSDKIKVCHVISGDLWGGAEAQAFGLIKGLDKHVGVSALLFNEGVLYSKLESAEIQVDLADERASSLSSLFRHVFAILTQHKPDVIHVHGFKENLIAGFAARLLDIRLVRTHHGRGMMGVRRHYTYVERLNAWLFSNYMIAVSRDLKSFLAEYGIAGKKIRVIRNGIECNQNAPATLDAGKESGLKQGISTIGTVGRLVSVKNHRCLLEALQQISILNKHVNLIVVGDGPLEQELADYAAQLGILDKVVFTGFQKDVNQFLSKMDVFVLSSRHEGIPISLLEAMCMNIPVVCTQVGGIPEVIKHGENGLLVDSNDPNALAAACLNIINDKSLAKRLVDNAYATVTGDLSFSNSLSETISLYNECW